jgi:hypothetical protein
MSDFPLYVQSYDRDYLYFVIRHDGTQIPVNVKGVEPITLGQKKLFPEEKMYIKQYFMD